MPILSNVHLKFDILFLCLTISAAFEDSLQSAVNAVSRRQRDLYGGPKYGYNNENGDSAFLENYDLDNMKLTELENLLHNYLEDSPYDYDKRILSPFREKAQLDMERQREKLESMLSNKKEEKYNSEDEYAGPSQEVYNKYRKTYRDLYDDYPLTYVSNTIKRSYPNYYSNLGWESVGMKKKAKSDYPRTSEELLYVLGYYPKEEANRFEEDQDYNNEEIYTPEQTKFSFPKKKSYGYPSKSYFLTKRSNGYYPSFKTLEKRSSKKDLKPKTDPKVAKDLNNIFTASNQGTKSEKPKKTKVKPTARSTIVKPLAPTKSNKKKETKETPASTQKKKPLQIEKKSIKWSDYFGLNRRKKDDLDNDWIMERYHKAVGMETKRSADYPLKNFKNHDEVKRDDKKENPLKEKNINEMDSKLKNIEESIIDETLKYTGAHEGTEDPKEIQDVKDEVISRLAAAYVLEKMRRALGEYKLSIEKEKNRLKESPEENNPVEEKRVSVPRKQAIDEEREKIPEADNNIKCTDGNEDCEEQNYKIPSDLLEQNSWEKECPPVQRVCNEMVSVIGSHGKVFEKACSMHQMCLLCGENSWFAPTRTCNVLFLSKADELCNGDLECQKVARHSVRYLLNINRALRAEPLGDCDLMCPQNMR